jgi:hypothetical protein
LQTGFCGTSIRCVLTATKYVQCRAVRGPGDLRVRSSFPTTP